MNLDKKLNSLVNYEKTGRMDYRNYSLKNIRKLLQYYGNPHKKLKTIHISGTNGKGSVAFFLNSILISSGYKTGLFTSPHLYTINERIMIDSSMVKTEILNNYIDELFDVLKNIDSEPTYFDVLTFFAFRFFCEEDVDIAIIETGLGGRNDSTNLIIPQLSIITDISYDHLNILGNTIREITIEKAGIIKENIQVITSNTEDEILAIIESIASKKSSELFIYSKNFKTENIEVTIGQGFSFDFEFNSQKSNDAYIRDITLNNPCQFQIKNSSLAIAASILLNEKGFVIGQSNIKQGIATTKIPGRFELISQSPLIIFDPAHNPDALTAIIKSLKGLYPAKDFLAIICFMKDKEHHVMFDILKMSFNEIIYFQLDDERALRLADRQEKERNSLADSISSFYNCNDLFNYLTGKINKNSLIFISGTFRLYALSKDLSVMFLKT